MSLLDPNPRKLILTFDDGRAFDGELTDILDEYEVTGIFLACTDESIAPTFASAPLYRAFTAENRRYLLQRHFIGSHTQSHSNLGRMSGREQRTVLYETFERFGETFGFQPWCFSYPWGRYNGATLRLLDGLGVRYAFLAAPGTQRRRHPLLLPRLFLDAPDCDELGFDELLARFNRPLSNVKLAIRHLHARLACPARRAE